MNIITPSPSPLRLGFIGGSLSSAVGYAHFVACHMDNRWRLLSGCFCLDEQENYETAQQYGVPADRVYGDWRQMLSGEQGKIDAVVVLTPTPSHFNIVSACLESGFPVICEKSLATSSHAAQTLIDIQNVTQGFLIVTYNYSGYPMVREMRHKIQKGALGKILHFQAEMPQEGFIRLDGQGRRPMPQAWRCVDGNVPTIYLDLAVHLHQLIYYLTGQDPVELVSDHHCFGWVAQVVDNVSCLCRYSGGIQGQFWFSKSALGHRNGLKLRIYGSEKAAEWFQGNPEEMLLSHADGGREIMDRASAADVASLPRYGRFKAGHPAGFIESFANIYSDIADCLHQYKTVGYWQSEHLFGAELVREALYFLEAMANSANSKTWQKVAPENRDALGA